LLENHMATTMATRSLGGSASHLTVGSIGFGLMGLTWRPQQTPDEQAFAVLKYAIEAGATCWNAGAFYGTGPNGEMLNLQLIARFFTKYPELAPRVFLMVKGGLELSTFTVNGSKEYLRKEVEKCLEALDGKKILDLFECGRVDKKTPIEETIGVLAELIKEGKIFHIGLSECSAATIHRAAKVHPIATVEIEYSLWSTEASENGVIEACKEHNITIIAYSPIGRGILSGKWKKPEDVPPNLVKMFPRFSPENFYHNMKFVEFVENIASKKGVTPAQVAIAWVLTIGNKVIPIPGATTLERVKENCEAVKVVFSEEELKEIGEFVKNTKAVGGRYATTHEHLLWG